MLKDSNNKYENSCDKEYKEKYTYRLEKETVKELIWRQKFKSIDIRNRFSVWLMMENIDFGGNG